MKKMTYADLQRANASIRTTDIKGKQYAEVNQRINAFRQLHPEGGIVTELLSNDNGVCVIKATVVSAEGKVLGTGMAYEKESSSFINKTSYIENCETSAVGRALGMCGIGIDTSVASYEEVQTAIINQETANPKCAKCKKEVRDAQQVGKSKTETLKKYKKAYILCESCLEKAMSE